MTFLQTLQTKLLQYTPAMQREQQTYFTSARNLARAQFQLADDELSRRLWQDVADQGLDVDRVLNLMYGCWFQDDETAMQEADHDYLEHAALRREQAGEPPTGIFEHC
ncbi:MAG: hypothetical protein CMN96_01920 [Synechococcus sp. MED850]|nr:hypothetical protein [Synechococcus sp. MED850]OUW98967.1 MAG: hypothetical protein CBD89_01370 [Cyanobacteria bacterium TMED229]